MANNTSRAKTVFVVGAGASHEVNLPVGRKLADTIADMFAYSLGDIGDIESGDREFLYQINRHHRDHVGSLVQAAQIISHGVVLAASIDQFIDKHDADPRIALLGKAAIVASILDAERNSLLAVSEQKRERLQFLRLRKTWYWGLGNLLTARKGTLDRIFDDIAIICFNYDRCIEQFLAHYLSDFYNVPLKECRELVREKLKILRPYGQVAPIHGGNDMVNFGADWRPINIFALAQNIRTFTEAHDGKTVGEIRDTIRFADTIAFLGFHYLEQNMDVLTPPQSCAASKVFGTAHERSPYEISEIKSLVRQMVMGSDGNKRTRASGGEPIIEPMDCNTLFTDYGLGLKLAPLSKNSPSA